MTKRPTIVWFYHDLRLEDHTALTWAAARGPIIPIFIYDGMIVDGAASNWWLQNALEDLSLSFARHRIKLVLRRGSAIEILKELVEKSGADAVTWTRRYEPTLAARDREIADMLKDAGIEVRTHGGFLLFEPEQIHTKSGTVFKIFTPFSKACFNAAPPSKPLPVPRNMKSVAGLKSDQVKEWGLVPKGSNWTKKISREWVPNEVAAQGLVRKFIQSSLQSYKIMRDRPDSIGTSKLSPYLHFGHVSARQLWHALHHPDAQSPTHSSSSERYLLELLWRDFSWHLLTHIPKLASEPLQSAFKKFPWRRDIKSLRAWQRGQTGFPIVDAGMRELWETGWMHNRVRMITASFLIKDLLIDWREGLAWFWDTLVDADLGNNSASWQWVAGCGADAAPYFRIFNPTLQGQKFDPNGDYVRKFVPELAKLEAKYIHAPLNAPADILKSANLVLGKSYPLPIVDHKNARRRALSALKTMRSRAGKT